MKRPVEMGDEVWARIRRLPSDVRDRVIERAAILIYGAGMPPDEADRRALWLEAGIALATETKAAS